MKHEVKYVFIDLGIGTVIGVVLSFLIYGFIYLLLTDKSEAISFMWIGFAFGMPLSILFTFLIANSIRRNQRKKAHNHGIILDILNKHKVKRTKFTKCDYFGFELIADYENEKLWFINWETGYWQYWSFALVYGFDLDIQNQESGGGFFAYSIGSTVIGQELSKDVTNRVFEMMILTTKDDLKISLTKQLRGEYVNSKAFSIAVDFAVEAKQIIEELVKIDMKNHKA